MPSASVRLARPKEVRVLLVPSRMATLLQGLRPLKQRHPHFLRHVSQRITLQSTILRDAGVEGELTKALDFSADRQQWLCEALFFRLNPGLSPSDDKVQLALPHFKSLIHLKAAYDVLLEEKLFDVLERGSGPREGSYEDALDRVIGQLLASFQAASDAPAPSATSPEPRYLRVTKVPVLWEPPKGRQPRGLSQAGESSTQEAVAGAVTDEGDQEEAVAGAVTDEGDQEEAVAGAVTDEGDQAAGAAPSPLRHWMQETVFEGVRAREGHASVRPRRGVGAGARTGSSRVGAGAGAASSGSSRVGDGGRSSCARDGGGAGSSPSGENAGAGSSRTGGGGGGGGSGAGDDGGAGGGAVAGPSRAGVGGGASAGSSRLKRPLEAEANDANSEESKRQRADAPASASRGSMCFASIFVSMYY
ncbi:hypothetical protein IE81DRAFT_348172 [Ceraceosorus guamensis]|uniref:Uncharacterized protein n=1 Tax=Ceraceosorus guamensis TaxID=1522189 RepID=A0A316VVC9_9BASI|nr:hypothetical protein IE81DRAFT_348172 [Ceraceosorus guamensis]PWN41597.1 hypothetical protein IE81DRAFT_348172 [Ceraceosorus guamensis]